VQLVVVMGVVILPVQPMVVLVVLEVVVAIQILVLLALLGRQQTIPDQHNKVILLEHLDQE
jgi:hypothetical protein